MSFWPDDVNDDEIRSPLEIMADAGDELESRTSRLSVRIGETSLKDRVVLSFQVEKLDAGLTLSLFEASHRPDQPYPVVIDPPSSDIPEFLNPKKFVPGRPGAFGVNELSHVAQIMTELQGTPGRYVKNEWVCATPTEFKKKLTDLFSRDHVKVRIVSLLASTSGISDDKDNPSPADKEPDVQ